MARLTKRVRTRFDDDPKREGLSRSLRGLREGDNRELYFGLALTALAYLRSTKPRKKLIYRKTVSEGSALVIHHKRSGTPKLEIRRP
jgi:hypothetical protein